MNVKEVSTKTVDFTGTVSWSTMRDIDIMNAFLPILEKYNPLAYNAIVDELTPFCHSNDSIDEILSNEEHTAWHSNTMAWVVNEMVWDAMNEIAPDGHYFGSHPGDGSDYGFWEIEEEAL